MSVQTFFGAYTIGNAPRSKWIPDSSVPGPGTYKNSFFDKPTSPSYKVRERFPLLQKSQTPGPGTYQQRSYIMEGPQMSFAPQNPQGIKPQQEEQNLGTGPAAYVPLNYTVEKNQSPKTTFGYQFDRQYESDVPPPGTYPKEKKIGDFYLDEKFNKKFIQEDDMKSQFGKSSMSGFGLAPQLKTIDSGTPGPGNYNVSQYLSLNQTGFKFGSSQRLGIYRDSVTPGPGAFNPQLQYPPGRASTLGFKGKGDKKEDFPGPGSYDPKQVKDTQNVFIGRSPQFGMQDREALNKPGPDAYSPDIGTQQFSYFKGDAVIGRAERPPLNIDPCTPGPGAYEIPSHTDQGPKYKMGLQLNDKQKIFESNHPGPHMYDPNYNIGMASSPQFSVTKGPRSDPVYSKLQNVGPGSYNPKSKPITYKFSIGNAKRFKDIQPDDTGPGSYDIAGTFGKIPEYLLSSQKRSQGIIDEK